MYHHIRHVTLANTHPIDPNILPVDPGRPRTSQKRNKGRHFVWQADPLLWMQPLEELNLLLCLPIPKQLGINGPRGHRVYGDAFGTELLGQDTVELFDCTFGGSIKKSGSGDEGE